MAEKYDPMLDLGNLVVTGLNYRNDTYHWASRIAERLGIGEDDYAETVAEVLRKALGLDRTEERQGVPAGTVMDLGAGYPRTVLRDGSQLLIPELRLDPAGCAVLRQIINNEIADLAALREKLEG